MNEQRNWFCAICSSEIATSEEILWHGPVPAHKSCYAELLREMRDVDPDDLDEAIYNAREEEAYAHE